MNLYSLAVILPIIALTIIFFDLSSDVGFWKKMLRPGVHKTHLVMKLALFAIVKFVILVFGSMIFLTIIQYSLEKRLSWQVALLITLIAATSMAFIESYINKKVGRYYSDYFQSLRNVPQQ